VRGETYPCLIILEPPQSPRSPRTSPLGLTSLKRKNHPIVVTLGGIGSCYASLALYLIAFYPCYKLCNNIARFVGIDGESLNYHMSKFWVFFQYRPVSREAEDLVMKLFSVTLHGEARIWHDNLPVASITSMDQFEEIFLARWVMKLEDIQSLLRGLECIKQTEDETVRVFGFRFQRLLY
jgi:hypothetical protein